MACITGLPLIFSDELDALMQPHITPAPSSANAPTANLDRMVIEAQTKFPTLHPYSLAWDDDEPRIFVNMSPSDDPKIGEFRTVIFDAHTGNLLEMPKGGTTLTYFLLQLHREIFLGLPGELLMGLMALLFVIALVSGILVYGPFMRRLNFGTYRRNATLRTRWFDLHNLLGIVTLAWAFVVGASGIMNALSTPLFGIWRAQTLPPILAPYHGKPVPKHFSPIEDAVKKTSLALPKMELNSVLFPNDVYGSPRHYVIWSKGKTPVTSRLFTPALIDVETGQMIVAQSLPWYLRAIEVSRPLHFGDYGGLPLKVIWALFDLALIVVLGSGVLLWLKKRSTSLQSELDRMVHMESISGVTVQ